MDKTSSIIKIQIALGLLISILIFGTFFKNENGDMNTVIFGTILYVPFALILCVYNGLIIGLFERLNKKKRIINYCISTIPLLIWFLLSDNLIRIRYWDLGTTEMTTILTLVLVTNIVGFYLTKEKDEETASR